MAQYYPVIVQAGNNLAGDSLGFHAYSLRVDNCTNQWYLEETSLAYIPPYSLGVCLRLYGTGVAILLNSAPIGQPQLARIVGEQLVGVYSDQLRTEVAPSPIRQFTLVQSVSDLTQGPQPATPPVGVTRMWAAPNGDLHYLLPNNTDALLLSTTNYAGYVGNSPLGGDLYGVVSNAHVAAAVQIASPTIFLNNGNAGPYIQNAAGASAVGSIRYACGGPSGYLHSFEVVGGGYGNVSCGNLTAQNGPIVSNNGLTVGAGAVSLPTNSIQKTALSVPAMARVLGTYQTGGSFSTSTLNTWIATPINVNASIGANESGLVVASATLSIIGSVVGTTIYAAISLNGVMGLYKMIHTPVANFATSLDITEYFAVTPGTSFSLQVYLQGNAGTISFNTACHQFLVVTEMVST